MDTSSMYVVFRVFKHYQAYQVIGQVYHDSVEEEATEGMIDEDMAYLTLEDKSGYLKFFPHQNKGGNPAAALLTRGAYSQYVSTAKWRPCLCEARERCWRLFSTFPFIRMESPLTAMSDGSRSFDPSFKD